MKLSKGDGDDEEDEEEEEGEAAEKDEKKSEEKTTFEKFYDEFKMFLLLGCHEDDANRSKLAKLLRFVSSYTEAQSVKKLTSLEDYVGRMQDEQPRRSTTCPKRRLKRWSVKRRSRSSR